MTRRTIIGFIVLGWLCKPETADAALTASVQSIEDFCSKTACWPNADKKYDLPYSHDIASKLGSYLTSYGYTTVSYNRDAGVDRADWWDVSLGGNDSTSPHGADWANLVFYAGHGSYSCSSNQFDIMMGDNNGSGTCRANNNQIRLGDNGTTAIAILYTCHSAQLCNFQAGLYSSMFAGRFGAYNGFHGVSYSGSHYVGLMNTYAKASKSSGVGSNWVNLVTEPDSYEEDGVKYDQCAVSITFGSTLAQVESAYSTRGLASTNWPTNNHSQSVYHYSCSCNPLSGEKLPSC